MVRLQPLYILFRVKQGFVFLINSRQRTVAAPLLNAREALFQSYDRFFAEFLNEKSPIPLGILAPAHLCWFCGTESLENKTETFLGTTFIRVFRKADSFLQLRKLLSRKRRTNYSLEYCRSSSQVIQETGRNINRLTIGYSLWDLP